MHLSLYNTYNNVSIFNSYRHQMDTYMDTKELLNQIKKPLFDKYPKIPLNWVCDEDILVHQIINEWSVEKCVYLLACSSEALEKLLGTIPLISEYPDIELDFEKNVNETIVWDWRHLLDIAINENWEQLEIDAKDHSSSMFVLGYFLICLLILAKIRLYRGNHLHNLDLFCVNFADILEQDKDPFIANFPKKSLDRIVKFIDNIYKKTTHKSLYDLDKKYLYEVNFQIAEAIHDAFPPELVESINKAIKGDKKINFIPNYVSKKIITEFTENNPKDILTWSIDKNIIIEESKETFKELLEDDNEIRLEKLIQLRNFKSDINKLLSIDNELLTPRQKEVVELVLIKEYKIVDAAKMIIGINNKPIDESVVRQHLKYALKKLRKILASFNQ